MAVICKQAEDELSDKPRQRRKFRICSNWRFGWGVIAALAVTMVILISAIILIVLYTSPASSSDKQETNFTDQSTESVPGQDLYVISRAEWFAKPSTDKLDTLHHPVPYVIISHSASGICTNLAACTLDMHLIQQFHQESKGWYDIGGNFYVGGNGYCYEGRGWDFVGAHTYGYNKRSIGITFLGTFISELPTQDQLKAAQLLIQKGVELGKIDVNYKLLGTCQVANTQSPGLRLYEELKTWQHWSPKP